MDLRNVEGQITAKCLVRMFHESRPGVTAIADPVMLHGLGIYGLSGLIVFRADCGLEFDRHFPHTVVYLDLSDAAKNAFKEVRSQAFRDNSQSHG